MSTSYDAIIRAFRVCDGFGGPTCDSLWWRTNGEFAPVTLLANCNDLFHWACADCEPITDDNIQVLEAASSELNAISDKFRSFSVSLFCCRIRNMRPQAPYYKYIDADVRHLFDACGPARVE